MDDPCKTCYSLVQSVTVVSIANAGVAVCGENGMTLVDTPVREQEPAFPYSGLSEDVFAAEFLSGGRFADANALLFTHAHSDHFSATMLMRYLTRNRVGYLLPPVTDRRLDIEYAAWDSECQIFPAPCAGRTPFALPLGGGSTVTAFPTRHMGQEYLDEPHCCLLLQTAGKNLLFLGDADPADCLRRIETDMPVHAAFATPPFLHSQKGWTFLQRLRPECLLVYHVPFAGRNDGLRRAAQIEAQKYLRIGQDTIVLSDPFQSVQI